MNSKTHTIIHLDGDDWHWYLVNNVVVTEGHSSLKQETLLAVLKALMPTDTFVILYAFLDTDLAERACMNAETLEDFKDLGFDESEFE